MAITAFLMLSALLSYNLVTKELHPQAHRVISGWLFFHICFSPATYVSYSSAPVCFNASNISDMNSDTAFWCVVFRFVLSLCVKSYTLDYPWFNSAWYYHWVTIIHLLDPDNNCSDCHQFTLAPFPMSRSAGFLEPNQILQNRRPQLLS